MRNDDLTGTVIGSAYKVHNKLGAGFIEKVYENALRIELDKLGFKIKQQEPIAVFYEGSLVGKFYADLWIDDRLIIEVKANVNLAKEFEVQLVNYLAATGVDDGLLINFGLSVQVKRKFREYKPKSRQLNSIS